MRMKLKTEDYPNDRDHHSAKRLIYSDMSVLFLSLFFVFTNFSGFCFFGNLYITQNLMILFAQFYHFIVWQKLCMGHCFVVNFNRTDASAWLNVESNENMTKLIEFIHPNRNARTPAMKSRRQVLFSVERHRMNRKQGKQEPT